MSLRWTMRRLRQRFHRFRTILAAAVGTLATVLSTVYDRIPAGFQITALAIMGVFTAAAVVLVEPSPESKYGRPLADSHANRRLNAGVVRQVRPRTIGRFRLILRRLLSRRSGKVVPMLPPQDELFTGRERELDELLSRHDAQREARTTRMGSLRAYVNALWRGERPVVEATGPVVVLIHGKPGVGKTALADAFARQLAPQYPDGHVFVNLGTAGAARSPNEILQDFLLALGWNESEMPETRIDRARILRSLTFRKRFLFILDAARYADQVRDVIPTNPATAVIVTSRRDLMWSDAPPGASYRLDVPDDDDAVEMFRAVSATDSSVRPECAAEIVYLCGRLPLAIRAAAERVANDGTDICNIAGLLRPRRSRLDRLDQPGRPLKLYIESEYQQLLPDEQRAMALLALVPSATFVPWILGPLMGVPAVETEALVDRLAAATLLDDLGTDETSGVARYGFHPLFRLFAEEKARLLDPDVRRLAEANLVDAYTEVVEAVLGVLESDFPQRSHRRFLDADSTLPKRIASHPEGWVRSEYANLLRVVASASHGAAANAGLCWRVGAWLNGCVADSVSVQQTLTAYEHAHEAAHNDSELGRVDVLLAKGTYLIAIERYDQAEACLQAASDNAVRLFETQSTADARRGISRRIIAATRKMGEAFLQAAAYRQALEQLETAYSMAESAEDESEMQLLQILIGEAHHVDMPDTTYDQLLNPELTDATRYRIYLALAEAARRRREWRSAEDYLDQALRFMDGDMRRMATVQYRLARLLLDEHRAASVINERRRPVRSPGGNTAVEVIEKAIRRAAIAAVTFRHMENNIGAVRAEALLARALLASGHAVEAEHLVHAAQAEFASLATTGERSEWLLPIQARLRRAEGELYLNAGDPREGRGLLMESAAVLGDHQDWVTLDTVLSTVQRSDAHRATLEITDPRVIAVGEHNFPIHRGGVIAGPTSPIALRSGPADDVVARLARALDNRVHAEVQDALTPPVPVAFRGAVTASLTNATDTPATSPPLWRIPIDTACQLTVVVSTGDRVFSVADTPATTPSIPTVRLPLASSGARATDVAITLSIDAPFLNVQTGRLTQLCATDEGTISHTTELLVNRPGSYDLRISVLSAGRLVQALPIELHATADSTVEVDIAHG